MLIKIGDCFVDPEFVIAAQPFPAHCARIVFTRSELIAEDVLDLERELVEGGLLEAAVPVSEAEKADDAICLSDSEEAELVKFCKMGFVYVAKDKSGFVRVFKKKPFKDGAYWTAIDSIVGRCLDGDYDWLDWEQESAVEIAPLLPREAFYYGE